MAQHTKRLLIPRFWRVPKKENVFIISPRAGPHPKQACIPLGILIRNVLGLTETARETRRVLSAGDVLVDKKKRADANMPVGLFDIVEFPRIKKYYRILPSESGLEAVEIRENEAGWKLCQIMGKSTLKKGMVQLRLHDGRCILMKAEEAKKYRPGDSLKITVPGQKIESHIAFMKGSKALVFSGRNTGAQGAIKEISERRTLLEKSSVVISAEGRDIRTIKDYVMPVGHVSGERK